MSVTEKLLKHKKPRSSGVHNSDKQKKCDIFEGQG